MNSKQADILLLVRGILIVVLFCLLPFVVLEALIYPIHISKTFVFLFILVGIVSLFVTHLILGKDRLRIRITMIDILLIILFGYILVNRYILQDIYSFSFGFYELLGLAVLYVIIRHTDSKYWIWFLLALVGGGLLQAVYGNLQLYGYYPSHHSSFAMTGSFFNPGPYAGFLAAVFPVALGIYLFRSTLFPGSFIQKTSIPSNSGKSNDAKSSRWHLSSSLLNVIRHGNIQTLFSPWLSLTSMAVILLVLPASQSRAAILAVMISVAYLLFQRYNWKAIVLARFDTPVKKVLSSMLLVVILSGGLTATYWVKKDSADGRILIWQVTSQMIQSRPLTGLGFDRFKAGYMPAQATWFQNSQDMQSAVLADNNLYAFNEVLQFTAEQGLIGLAFLIVLGLLIGRVKNETGSGQLTISKAGLLAILVFALFSYPAQILPIKLSLTLFLAIIASFGQPYTLRFPSVPQWVRLGIKGSAVTLFLWGIIYVTIHINELYSTSKQWKFGLDIYNTGDIEQSLSVYESIYPVFYRNGDFLMNYGKALSMAGADSNAIEILGQAKRHLNNTIIQTALGDSYKALEMNENAEQAYKLASDMLPDRFYPQYLLVKLYEASSQREKAISLATKLLHKKVKIQSTAVEEIKQEMEKMLALYQDRETTGRRKLKSLNEDLGNLPIEINKRVVISEKCDKIIYSSNRYNFFNPSIIQGVFAGDGISKDLLNQQEKDLLPYSISSDCRYVSLVSNDLKTHTYTIYLYDLKNEQLVLLPQNQRADNGFPVFSSVKPLLAYLSNTQLKLYNHKYEEHIETVNFFGASFKNLAWSPNGKYIFLQDYFGNLWHYNLMEDHYKLMWKSPAPFHGNRMITPISNEEKAFYFISDHESEFNQIYKYEGQGRIHLVVRSPYDKYLLKHLMNEEAVYYRENKKGYYGLKRFKKGEVVKFGFEQGVIYDAYPYQGGLISLYASLNTPASIFQSNDEDLIDLINHEQKVSIPHPKKIYNEKGMYHLLYQPASDKIKKWVLWLHGGPYEQMSIRYNVYINNLVQAGYGIIALNYPGSTGAGNSYEMRNMPSDELIVHQIKAIEKDIHHIEEYNPKLEFNGLYVVGVSYGSILAHRLVNRGHIKISKLVDFSGLYAGKNTPAEVPKLYIFGEHDFILENANRIDLIKTDTKKYDNNKIIIEDEGHFINHYQNIRLILEELLYFFNNTLLESDNISKN